MSDDCASALPVVYRQLADARARILDFENREAACCPEDVGFEEYIATLQRQLAEANQKLAWHQRSLYGSLPPIPEGSFSTSLASSATSAVSETPVSPASL